MDFVRRLGFYLFIFCIIAFQSMQAQNAIGFDSLVSNVATIDTLKNKTENLSSEFNYKLDSATIKFNVDIDSLRRLGLPSEAYAQKLDSSYRSFQKKVIGGFQKKYDSLGLKADQRLSKIDSVLSSKTHYLDSLLHSNGMKEIGDRMDVNKKFDTDMKLPVLQDYSASTIVNSKVPQSPGTQLPGVKAPGISDDINLGLMEKIDGAGAIKELKSIANVTGDIKTISAESDKIKMLNGTTGIEKEIESRALKTNELSALNAQQKEANALKEKLESIKKTSNRDSLQNLVKTEFVDHFAGKEEMIKKDMESIAKIQMKYRNVADSRYLPKHPPNEMKGKPFVERLIPGVGIQVYRGDNLTFDVAPFLAYRLSGHVVMGISGYCRLTYIEDHNSVKIKNEDLLGVRLFNDFKLLNGFYAHTELQYFRDRSSIANKIPPVEINGKWQNKFNFGLYRTYKLGKNINGNIVLLYDLLKIKEFPNTRNVAMRFGFEYQIRKRKMKNVI
jgi:hypothetical protein